MSNKYSRPSKKSFVGGQAVIEGVMMRGSKGVATAVRKLDGDIEIDFKDVIPLTKKNKIFSYPIIRGFITLIDSFIIGTRALNYSASLFDEDTKEDKETKLGKWIKNKLKVDINDIIMILSFIISLLISLLVFFAFPTFLANEFKKVNINNTILLNICEGLIRVVLFLSYIIIISRMSDIKRVFEYHGAEHKTIFCYENNDELNAKNACKYSRLHPRCGTNFLFLVMIVSIILFSFTGWASIEKRMFFRIILLPVVSGVTYEIIRWVGRCNNKVAKVLSFPGLMLQKLTTREPDLSKLEVAIVALEVAEGIKTIEELKKEWEFEDNTGVN